jgi:hypothetical protein
MPKIGRAKFSGALQLPGDVVQTMGFFESVCATILG